MKAREIRIKLGWAELRPKQADRVLVVVRSSLYDPLRYSYDSYGELKMDAESQLNIARPNYHIYIYTIFDDLSVLQTEHESFSAYSHWNDFVKPHFVSSSTSTACPINIATY